MRVERAFILAAGFGTRLKPLSELVPKPAWPLFDTPIAARLVASLASAGVEDFIVNLHHLPDALERALTPHLPAGARVRWSREERILGTGGALVPWLEELAEGPFFLANADTFRAFDPGGMIRFFSGVEGVGCLSLVRLPDGARGPIKIDREGRIVEFLGARAPDGGPPAAACDFTGMHLLSPEVGGEVEKAAGRGEFFCVNADVHRALVARGAKLWGYLPEEAYFSDLGTPGSYLAAHFDFLDRGAAPAPSGGTLYPADGDAPGGGRIAAPAWLGEGARVLEGGTAGPHAVVGSGSLVEPGGAVVRSVVWPGVAVRERVEGCALAPEGRVCAAEFQTTGIQGRPT